MFHCLSCCDAPSLGPTLVFSHFQVLLSHLGEFKKKKKGKEGIKRERQEEGKKRKKEREEGVKRKKILNKKALCWLLTGQASFSGIPGCSRLRGHWFSFSSFLISTCPASSPVSQFATGPPCASVPSPALQSISYAVPKVHQLGAIHTPPSLSLLS